MVIGGTLSPHKRTHKIPRISPHCRTQNQTDHITINRKWKAALIDVRNKRTDINSDQYLMVATNLQLKLKQKKIMSKHNQRDMILKN
jgi:hypothetical protein